MYKTLSVVLLVVILSLALVGVVLAQDVPDVPTLPPDGTAAQTVNQWIDYFSALLVMLAAGLVGSAITDIFKNWFPWVNKELQDKAKQGLTQLSALVITGGFAWLSQFLLPYTDVLDTPQAGGVSIWQGLVTLVGVAVAMIGGQVFYLAKKKAKK